jgi:hypothetical protein
MERVGVVEGLAWHGVIVAETEHRREAPPSALENPRLRGRDARYGSTSDWRGVEEDVEG